MFLTHFSMFCKKWVKMNLLSFLKKFFWELKINLKNWKLFFKIVQWNGEMLNFSTGNKWRYYLKLGMKNCGTNVVLKGKKEWKKSEERNRILRSEGRFSPGITIWHGVFFRVIRFRSNAYMRECARTSMARVTKRNKISLLFIAHGNAHPLLPVSYVGSANSRGLVLHMHFSRPNKFSSVSFLVRRSREGSPAVTFNFHQHFVIFVTFFSSAQLSLFKFAFSSNPDYNHPNNRPYFVPT